MVESARMLPVKTLHTDVLVIGAGLIGSAVSMGLTLQNTDRVLVVDLDIAGEWSSSELNAGGVRATWSQKVNLLASKFSIEYYMKHAESVGYRGCGYLWLHRPNTFESALQARKMHVASGWDVEVWDQKEIQRRIPFIDKTDDLAGALFGVNDGLVNPNRLKEHFREEAIAKGAKLLDGIWVCKAEPKSSEGGWKVRAFQFSEQLTSEQKKQLLSENPETLSDAQGAWIEIEAKNIVNCAGAWAPHLAKILGYSSPSQPVRRQISLFHARGLDLTPYGMIIDPSGVYFHPESIYGLSGFATPDEPAGFNFQYDGEKFFEEQIWAPLYERSTAFESLRHVSGWAGLYENSPDHHAIIGKVEGAQNLYEAHSSSGHGAMQSYAFGIAMGELIAQGKYQTLDLTELSGNRFVTGQTIPSETWVI